MPGASVVTETDLKGLELVHRGKVRDVYAVGDDLLLLVATDRISAFDCVMPNPIPFKGAVLTQLSAFWFEKLSDISPNHLVTVEFDEMPAEVRAFPELRGRASLVRRTKVYPVECVVRGYLEGSGLKDYKATGSVCGHRLPEGLLQCGRLPEALFTPATKAAAGHDENISESEFERIVGTGTARTLKERTLAIYRKASEYAASRGIIIADTKFEFGAAQTGETLLIDEVLTPDSSRFWPADSYEPGRAQKSFDKQYLREYLETLDWNKQYPAPELPPQIVDATAERYREAFRLLTGREFKP